MVVDKLQTTALNQMLCYCLQSVNSLFASYATCEFMFFCNPHHCSRCNLQVCLLLQSVVLRRMQSYSLHRMQSVPLHM